MILLMSFAAAEAEEVAAEVEITGVSDLFEGRTPSAREIANQEWHLFSAIFPALPKGGYPFEFRADGTVISENLGGVAAWKFTAEGIQILDPSGHPYSHLHFRFDACQDALEASSPLDPETQAGMMFPFGMTLRLKNQPGLPEACPGSSSEPPNELGPYFCAVRPFCCRPCDEPSE